MACNLRRIANLPIQEELKIRLIEFFQKPENMAACERLNTASDEELVQLVQGIAQRMSGAQGAPQGAPNQAPGGQGIASMQQPTRPPVPPGMPGAPESRPAYRAGDRGCRLLRPTAFIISLNPDVTDSSNLLKTRILYT